MRSTYENTRLHPNRTNGELIGPPIKAKCATNISGAVDSFQSASSGRAALSRNDYCLVQVSTSVQRIDAPHSTQCSMAQPFLTSTYFHGGDENNGHPNTSVTLHMSRQFSVLARDGCPHEKNTQFKSLLGTKQA